MRQEQGGKCGGPETVRLVLECFFLILQNKKASTKPEYTQMDKEPVFLVPCDDEGFLSS